MRSRIWQDSLQRRITVTDRIGRQSERFGLGYTFLFDQLVTGARRSTRLRNIQEAQFDRASGYTSAMRLLHMLPRPTAIFATNDLMAMGVLLAIRDSKLVCPNDVSVISFDGLDVTELTDPALTTVYQPGYQLGYAAARLLRERIEGCNDPAREIELDTELRIRHSVARINPA